MSGAGVYWIIRCIGREERKREVFKHWEETMCMICLGIESTAHTFGVGIVERAGRLRRGTTLGGGWGVLANERSMYTPPAGVGIHPIEAKKHHEQVKEAVLEAALAKTELADIDF